MCICVYVNKYTYRYLYIRVCMGIYMYVSCLHVLGDVYVQMYLRELSTSTYWDFVSQTKLGSCVPKYVCVLPAAICLCGTF